MLAQNIPLSLYIHIPWCVRKCPYCDFNSHESKEGIPEQRYIDALLADLDQQLPKIQNRPIISIFFGGGTPSLFSPEGIERILLGVKARLRFHPEVEITLEANPGTVDESRFQGFREAGVNRLSLGLQSLQNDKLKKLGRIHDREKALRAIEVARQASFTNFNVDLMHGLPDQSVDDALNDLRDALHFNPPHLSWYQLTLEPNTVFHKYPPTLPPDETLWTIQEEGKKLLSSHRLKQYEVSAYAASDQHCKHNVNYWEFGDYLGLGAGAHSKLTDITQQVVTRHWQMRMPTDYLNPDKPFVVGENILSREDLIFEFMLNALRLNSGVPIDLFSERTGLDLNSIQSKLRKAIEKNLLCDSVDLIKASELGQLFLNDLTGLFLPKV